MNIVEENIDQINTLCSKHKVAKMYVFGSVLTNRFEENSDIDFIVDFDDVELSGYADNYFDLKFALEKIFNRNVDILENKAIRNPFFRKSINSSKKLVYG